MITPRNSPNDAYRKVRLWGAVFDKKTALALMLVNKRLGYDSLTVAQGSYVNAVRASFGTHDGGGAVDLAPYQWYRKVRQLRRAGFAAWHRSALPGVWPEHIHAVQLHNRNASPTAKIQWEAYARRRDGLASNLIDTFAYHPNHRRYRYWIQRRAHPKLRKALDALPVVS